MGRPDETDDEAIDRMWRARFGQPLPVMGSAAFARKILSEWMTEPDEAAGDADRRRGSDVGSTNHGLGR
jgi:hypothetical protein